MLTPCYRTGSQNPNDCIDTPRILRTYPLLDISSPRLFSRRRSRTTVKMYKVRLPLFFFFRKYHTSVELASLLVGRFYRCGSLSRITQHDPRASSASAGLIINDGLLIPHFGKAYRTVRLSPHILYLPTHVCMSTVPSLQVRKLHSSLGVRSTSCRNLRHNARLSILK